MDFFTLEWGNFTVNTNRTDLGDENANNFLTFVIGFSVLIAFILMGIAASAFLCLTLKKESYLWEMEQQMNCEPSDDKFNQNSTEI